jgi:AAA family ATP:ADP antiporter
MGIYLLRPMRDELALVSGVENLPFFFSITFIIVLLLHFASRKFFVNGRKKILLQYLVLVLIPLGIFISHPLAQGDFFYSYFFFSWVSVLSLWMVSSAWEVVTSLRSQVNTTKQIAKISSAATAGSLAGIGYCVMGRNCFIDASTY